MLLLISDASVLIAMNNGELLNDMFALPFTFATPDVMYIDELQEHYPNLRELGLITPSMNAELIAKVDLFKTKYPRISSYDCHVLVLAEEEKAILLTGDRLLRVAALQENVEVHGTIWLIEQMLIQEMIDKYQADQAFSKMSKNGDHLPPQEIRQMLDKY